MTLGSILRQVRSEKRLSAKQVLDHAGLDISLALYSQWENNKKIPSPKFLLALCGSLGINVQMAFQLWAQSQMPTEELKKLFPLEGQEVDVPVAFQEKDPTAVYPANRTKTLEERDIPFFFENPAAATMMLRTLAASNSDRASWPLTKLIDGLGISSEKGQELCDELEKRKYIVRAAVGTGYRAPENVKFYFMPDTEPYEKLRVKRFGYNFQRVLNNTSLEKVQKGKGFRVNLTNKLSEKALKNILEEMKRVANHFLTSTEKVQGDSEKYFQLVAVVGPEYEEQ